METTLALKPGDAEMATRQARRVVDLVTRVAVMAISVGGSVSEAIAMALRITATYGVTVHIDITNASVIVTQHRGLEEDPITALRVVRSRSNDYQRLGELQLLVDSICDRSVGLEEAADRLAAITRSPRLYRQWFVTMNMGLMGAGLSTIFGGTAMDGVLSFISTCIVDATVQAMARKRITNFFTQAAGGAIATVFALLVMEYMAISHEPLPLSPSLIVASGIVSLLAGGSFVTASQDALDGYVVTSSGRFLEGFVQTGGIILGVITAMWIGLRLGVPGYISPSLGFSTDPVLQMICAAVIAVTFGISSHAGYRTLAICAVLGAAAWAGYLVGMQLTGSVSAASGLGAMVAGIIAALGARRWKVPQLGLVTIAIVPLMPGVMMYRALYMIVNAQNGTTGVAKDNGWTLFLEALLVGVALAVGSSFGALIARPFTLPKDLRSRLATLASWGAGQAVPRERRRRRHQPPADPHHRALNDPDNDPSMTGTWAR
ncbi:threonine/serine exporter family protein [Cutibacterium equinum]|uniref:Threonine/serine exporter family protein n=1 Tax=Cutibacterium equinum TaxID=3016342 RepID=A0ABY7R0Y3_9ACTN|nr:threonine/serine exporter family protein [Cutibacterium equinum]WCC80961.1 threonine/serine exporter family protein [Cutibacterium equinum]